MKRPVDQVKLLFFYLLRNSAAMATRGSASAAASKHVVFDYGGGGGGRVSMLRESGHISLRLARQADVPSIQRCNLATLPENYNTDFYTRHLQTWPDLALVVEHKTPSYDDDDDHDHDSVVVGYLLGKLERRAPIFPGFASRMTQEESRHAVGHVTSLAVLEGYRRKGLAEALLRQLHVHLEHRPNLHAVGLHVRESNQAATRLYKRNGYTIQQVIPRYYQDGEDAYYMSKQLTTERTTTTTTSSSSSSSWMQKKKPWEHAGSAFQLPRIIYDYEPDNETIATEQDELEEEVAITGT